MGIAKIPLGDDPWKGEGRTDDPSVPIPFVAQAQPTPGIAADAGAGAPPPMKAIPRLGDDTPLGRFAQPILPPAPPTPNVVREQTPLEGQIGKTDTKLKKLQDEDANPFGSANNHPGIGGKILHGLSEAGNIAGNILAPGTMELIPGTQLNRKSQENELSTQLRGLTKDKGQQEETEARTKNLDAQPELNATKSALAQEKQNEVENFHNATTAGNQGKLQASLAQHGFAPDEANPGQLRPLRYEEMSPTQQAVTDLKGAQQEQAEATAALRTAQNDPSSPAYKIAMERVNVARQNAQTAIGRLGLSGQEFQFNQDKFYNPQPTGSERNKGDLAQSAIERVQEMRAIKDAHPDWFGPGAGRWAKVQAAIGSQDPDLQRYQSAATYLADHSAGVFGGRSKYISEQLHSLTDPKMNPEALGAALDEAERAAKGFVKAGATHGKGGSSSFAGGSPGPESGAPKPGDVRPGNDGNYRFKGGDQYDQKNWEKVAK